jgi:hypothetical protein
MGTDIHSVAQVRDPAPGFWRRVADAVMGTSDCGTTWRTVAAQPGGDDRQYNVFAVLAGVRNGVGFAGVKTGDTWDVLFPPRGLPEDLALAETDEGDEDYGTDAVLVELSEPYYRRYDEEKKEPIAKLWLGEHSFSWLTLTELRKIRDHHAGKTYTITGMISPDQDKALSAGKIPDAWCGFTSDRTHVQRSWEVPCTEMLGGLARIVRVLDEIAVREKASPDDVRLVFGFDS